MTPSEFTKHYSALHPKGKVRESKLNIFFPTYEGRTWQCAITEDDEVGIRIINDKDPEDVIVQELFLSKEAFWQMKFIIGFIEDHLPIDEEALMNWCLSLEKSIEEPMEQ